MFSIIQHNHKDIYYKQQATINMSKYLSKQALMSKELASSFINEVNKAIILQGEDLDLSQAVMEDIDLRQNFVNFDITIDDYKYYFSGSIYELYKYNLIYEVIRTKKNEEIPLIIYNITPVIYNDVIIETVDFKFNDGKIVMGDCITYKYKKNACILCGAKPYKCCKTHDKTQKHKNNVIKRNKLYADTIAETTKLNPDVCNLIVSYLF